MEQDVFSYRGIWKGFLTFPSTTLKITTPQIAAYGRLSERHIVPKTKNTFKMGGTFRKRAFFWQEQNPKA